MIPRPWSSFTTTCLRSVALMLAIGVAPAGVSAQDLSWSGFATAGHAHTVGLAGRYLRWIDNDGSFNTQSVLAGQVVATLSPQWSATVQLKAAPSDRSDSRWRLEPSWAFVAWRPRDEWLLRAGRMRTPLYLHSESLDVGESHDMARLPVEMYSIVPTNEFDGVSAIYSRPAPGAADAEISLESYAGRIDTTARFWLRDGVPGVTPAGAWFTQGEVRMFGLVGSWRSRGSTWRLGITDARTHAGPTGQVPRSVPFVAIGPGLGYYKVNDALPGPPLDTVSSLRNIITTFGAEQELGDGWRLAVELARNKQLRTELGSDTTGGYVAVFKQLERFTPYASWGRLISGQRQMQNYRQLKAVRLPDTIPGAAFINASQRFAAETIYATEQRTLALGSSWALPTGGKVKLEWARVNVGEVSRLIDTPPDSAGLRQARFDTWSFNYSLAF